MQANDRENQGSKSSSKAVANTKKSRQHTMLNVRHVITRTKRLHSTI